MPIDLADSILTIDEAAEFARVSADRIKSWLEDGLRHMRTADNDNRTGPRMVIVRKSALLEFVESREVVARSQADTPEAPAGKPKKAKAAATFDDPYNLMGEGRRNSR